MILGDSFSFPDNFAELFNKNDTDLKRIFKISLAPNKFHKLNHTIEMLSYSASKVIGIKRGKTIEERTVKELIGSVLKEFMDSDRYETTDLKSQNILVFKFKFDHPWDVSVNLTDVLRI